MNTMTSRLNLMAARRYTAALWRPILACLAVTTATLVAHTTPGSTRSGDQRTGTGIALVATVLIAAALVGWLARDLRREVVQPRDDREAAEHLADLRAAAGLPGHMLIEITHIQWVSRAGQRVWAIDTATGGVNDHWIPGAALPPGAFVLLRVLRGQAPEVLKWMPAESITAALRDTGLESRSRQVLHARDRQESSRQEKAAARDVIDEAEWITRQHSPSGSPGESDGQ